MNDERSKQYTLRAEIASTVFQLMVGLLQRIASAQVVKRTRTLPTISLIAAVCFWLGNARIAARNSPLELSLLSVATSEKRHLEVHFGRVVLIYTAN